MHRVLSSASTSSSGRCCSFVPLQNKTKLSSKTLGDFFGKPNSTSVKYRKWKTGVSAEDKTSGSYGDSEGVLAEEAKSLEGGAGVRLNGNGHAGAGAAALSDSASQYDDFFDPGNRKWVDLETEVGSPNELDHAQDGDRGSEGMETTDSETVAEDYWKQFESGGEENGSATSMERRIDDFKDEEKSTRFKIRNGREVCQLTLSSSTGHLQDPKSYKKIQPSSNCEKLSR
jgi:hypothetical protein